MLRSFSAIASRDYSTLLIVLYFLLGFVAINFNGGPYNFFLSNGYLAPFIGEFYFIFWYAGIRLGNLGYGKSKDRKPSILRRITLVQLCLSPIAIIFLLKIMMGLDLMSNLISSYKNCIPELLGCSLGLILIFGPHIVIPLLFVGKVLRYLKSQGIKPGSEETMVNIVLFVCQLGFVCGFVKFATG